MNKDTKGIKSEPFVKKGFSECDLRRIVICRINSGGAL